MAGRDRMGGGGAGERVRREGAGTTAVDVTGNLVEQDDQGQAAVRVVEPTVERVCGGLVAGAGFFATHRSGPASSNQNASTRAGVVSGGSSPNTR